jgi:hypothetical protein
MMGLGDDLDPVAQALKEGRKPTDADYAARYRWQQLKPQIAGGPKVRAFAHDRQLFFE